MSRWCARRRRSPTSSPFANGISRAFESAPRSPDRRVPFPCSIDAPRARAGGREIEEDEAIEDRGFAHIDDGPEALREMSHEIAYRHLAGANESGEPGEQPQRDQRATGHLDDR